MSANYMGLWCIRNPAGCRDPPWAGPWMLRPCSASTLSLSKGRHGLGPRPENGIFDERDLRFAPTGSPLATRRLSPFFQCFLYFNSQSSIFNIQSPRLPLNLFLIFLVFPDGVPPLHSTSFYVTYHSGFYVHNHPAFTISCPTSLSLKYLEYVSFLYTIY